MNFDFIKNKIEYKDKSKLYLSGLYEKNVLIKIIAECLHNNEGIITYYVKDNNNFYCDIMLQKKEQNK